ncbi:hypothetical protein C8R47DRAFT_396333 [Mycena vitilis]|nr:hypothetical protein C8R47DRAFT_396333 [Mycena vitilis]
MLLSPKIELFEQTSASLRLSWRSLTAPLSHVPHKPWARRQAAPPHSMPFLDIIIGTALIGTWAGSMLTGVALAQATQYFNNFPNDGFVRKCLVAGSLLLCVGALGGEYAYVYLPLVTMWGNPAAFITETSSVTVYSVCNAFAAATVNSYLVSRYYRVSKNVFVTLFLSALILFQLVMAHLAVLLFPGIGQEQFMKAEKIGLIWAVSSFTADVAIAAALVFTLRGMKSSFTDTNRLLRRIIIMSIQNGCATSLMALGGMTAVILKVNSNISSAFYFTLAPLYVLTLLSNFNLRANGKSGSRSGWSSSRNNNTQIGPHSDIVIEGIHVRRDGGLNDPTESEIEIIPPSKRDHARGHRKHDSNPAYGGKNGGEQVGVSHLYLN